MTLPGSADTIPSFADKERNRVGRF
jgi:hypothetical protein